MSTNVILIKIIMGNINIIGRQRNKRQLKGDGKYSLSPFWRLNLYEKITFMCICDDDYFLNVNDNYFEQNKVLDREGHRIRQQESSADELLLLVPEKYKNYQERIKKDRDVYELALQKWLNIKQDIRVLTFIFPLLLLTNLMVIWLISGTYIQRQYLIQMTHGISFCQRHYRFMILNISLMIIPLMLLLFMKLNFWLLYISVFLVEITVMYVMLKRAEKRQQISLLKE